MEDEKRRSVSKEQVIAKLKDDGDFDNLRLEIIHKLKQKEELRNSIISIVRQSAALNRAGAENMKPRQLSDAIYDEVRSEVMGKISNGIWEIIKSGDGMKDKITETVQSVYGKLVEPDRNGRSKSSTHDIMVVQNEGDTVIVKASAVAVDDRSSNGKLQEPPGFPLAIPHQNNHEPKEELQLPLHSRRTREEQRERPEHSKDIVESDDDPDVPPGFSEDIWKKQPCNTSDEDPDVPPGFG